MKQGDVLKLGEALEVALAVADLPVSLAFYKTLGFSQFADPYTEPHPWVVLSDGKVHLGLHQYEEPSPALVYFTNEFEKTAAYVESLGVPITARTKIEGKLISIGFRDPNGQRIGVADLMGAQIDMPQPAGKVNIGDFGEFSIPTKHLEESVAFYRRFGFEGETYSEPYPWAILQDGLITIGLHQTDEFTEPAITYFDHDMPKIIQWVEAQGISLQFSNRNEDGVTHQAGIRSPDGQPFYLFNW